MRRFTGTWRPRPTCATWSSPAGRRGRCLRCGRSSRSPADDPELFAAYRTLAADAKSAVAAHVDELIELIARVVRDGVREGTFRATDPMAAGRAILIATSGFHHPAHYAEWTDPAIDADYEAVWQLLKAGLSP